MRPCTSLGAFVIVAIMAYGQSVPTDEQSLRMLVKTFADARNAHDGERIAALYSEDGEWIGATGKCVKGRRALASLRSNLPGQVQRTIRSVDFISGQIAAVRVATQYEEPNGLHHEAFVFVKQDGVWKIRDHQTIR